MHLPDLPDDILVEIISILSIGDNVRLYRTCSKLLQLRDHPLLCKKLLLRDYNIDYDPIANQDKKGYRYIHGLCSKLAYFLIEFTKYTTHKELMETHITLADIHNYNRLSTTIKTGNAKEIAERMFHMIVDQDLLGVKWKVPSSITDRRPQLYVYCLSYIFQDHRAINRHKNTMFDKIPYHILMDFLLYIVIHRSAKQDFIVKDYRFLISAINDYKEELTNGFSCLTVEYYI